MSHPAHPPPVSPLSMINTVKDTQHDDSRGRDAVAGGDEEHEQARGALPLPDVPEPSPAEVALHNLTHLPFRRWCRWCVMARRANRAHKSLPPVSRAVPLLVLDYCFVKHAGDDRWLTVLIGRMYPSRAMFGAPCYKKGAGEYVTARPASFLRVCVCGFQHHVHAR